MCKWFFRTGKSSITRWIFRGMFSVLFRIASLCPYARVEYINNLLDHIAYYSYTAIVKTII